ncbi:hypothetical protein C5167_012569, partial [Papaver somniferum]
FEAVEALTNIASRTYPYGGEKVGIDNGMGLNEFLEFHGYSPMIVLGGSLGREVAMLTTLQ